MGNVNETLHTYIKLNEEYLEDSQHLIGKWCNTNEKWIILSLEMLLQAIKRTLKDRPEMRFALNDIKYEANSIFAAILCNAVDVKKNDILNGFIFKKVNVNRRTQ